MNNSFTTENVCLLNNFLILQFYQDQLRLKTALISCAYLWQLKISISPNLSLNVYTLKTSLLNRRPVSLSSFSTVYPACGQYRAQRDSIRSQTFHSKGTAYDITKYQTFLTKCGIVCPFKGHLLTAEGQHTISCNTLFSGRNTPLKARITR